MKITVIRLTNIRCFHGRLSLDFDGRINLFVGPNNAGKSTVLWALGYLQQDGGGWHAGPFMASLRLKDQPAEIALFFDGPDARLAPIVAARWDSNTLRPALALACNPSGSTSISYTMDGVSFGHNAHSPAVISDSEPNNVFRFFLSRRKSVAYDHTMNSQVTKAVRRTFQNVHAKVSRLSVSAHPKHDLFQEYMRRVLGFKLGVAPSGGGQETVLFLPNGDHIALDYMGEGVANIVALLADLAVANGDIFLIEEIENDIHPSALAALLKVIEEKSETNQFFISSHSNVVVSRLGSFDGTHIFSFAPDFKDGLPTSTVTPVPATAEARHDLLRALGYELSDMSLSDGYLIFEESSAEAIIKQVLIPLFVPELSGRLQTYSSGGASKVQHVYEALHRVFVFIHQTPAYRDKSWVRVDGDEDGKAVVTKLTGSFGAAKEGSFAFYRQPRFEDYYPISFKEKVEAFFAIKEKETRREAKIELCREVLKWARENPAAAKEEFATSAAEVIADLLAILKQL